MKITTTMPTTFAQLEALALAAHAAGVSWSAFWSGVAEHVLYMADGDRLRFERLRDRLLCVLVSGSMDGLEPPGSGAGLVVELSAKEGRSVFPAEVAPVNQAWTTGQEDPGHPADGSLEAAQRKVFPRQRPRVRECPPKDKDITTK